MRFTRIAVTFTVLLAALASFPVFADLVLTAPPRESAEEGMAIYGPIAKYLSEQLGQNVVYKHPVDWSTYAVDMRNDSFDIVFDGPHFAAWRMKHLQHTPLITIPGDLGFVVVVNADDNKIKQLRNLKTKKTCGMASPNLSMLTYLSQFHDDSLLPPVVEVKGGIPEVYKAFLGGQCSAAILRNHFYESKISDQDKKKLRVIFTSKPLPNQTITVSRRLQGKSQEIVRTSLLSVTGRQSAMKLLERFSKSKPTFAQAEVERYAGAENLLEGIVWGW